MSTKSKVETIQDLNDAIETAQKYGVEFPPSVLTAIENLNEEFDDAITGDEIFITWSIGDIDGDDKYNLTDEQKRDILISLERRHDAEQGINWDVIDAATELYVANHNGE